MSALFTAAAIVTAVLAADLASYQPRNTDRPIADIYFEQVGTRRYRATLTRLPGGRMQVFELAGDAWRLDMRTLDFGGWARALGVRPGYRLERLVAVERPAADAPSAPSRGFALDPRDGFDLWRVSRHSGRWRNLVSAGEARSEELPMSGRSRFELSLAGGRIDVRAANEVAQTTVTPAP